MSAKITVEISLEQILSKPDSPKPTDEYIQYMLSQRLLKELIPFCIFDMNEQTGKYSVTLELK